MENKIPNQEDRIRCRWCNTTNPLYVDYHDHEWGIPVHEDGKLFEMLLLETFQAGLSWECVLNKREAFRRAFDGFDATKIAVYDEEKLLTLQQDKGIIRNRLKIQAAVTNARIFNAVRQEYGSFDETDRTTSPLSDTISKDLYRKGMKFVGSTIIYSYLQAIGIINSHEEGCWLARKNAQAL